MESKGMSQHAVSSSVDVSQSVEEDPLVDGPLISHDALQSAIRRESTSLPTHFPAVLLLLLQVRTLKHLAFVIHSAGNTAVLVVMSADLSEANHLPVYLLLGILGLELLVSLPCLVIYTVRVVRFNRDRAGPDVSQEEPSNSYNTTETGFREGSSLEEVVEKQADLIDYLKHHNTLLSKRLLNMTTQH
ncbi:transmembrane protein 192 isoform X2 [Salmo salar]|uniref:Transmembrane protein 192 n=1 Tax=Salmo salar TaxID=8030 RepID=A0ABM3EGN3_SALSA|nr:transmembrane protein 192 isoform X2 [Salmo salar]XP_045570183.1 transmembrane protein 192-like isoform X2 [Salmo salar]